MRKGRRSFWKKTGAIQDSPTKGAGSYTSRSPSPGQLAAQAQWSGLAMPTVSLKRDLLFRALGRTYSEYTSDSLGSAPLLRGWDPLQKGIVAMFILPRRFWPWAFEFWIERA